MKKALIYLLVVLIGFVDVGSAKVMAAPGGPVITISIDTVNNGTPRNPVIELKSDKPVSLASGTGGNTPGIQVIDQDTLANYITIDPTKLVSTDGTTYSYKIQLPDTLKLGHTYKVHVDKGLFEDGLGGFSEEVDSQPFKTGDFDVAQTSPVYGADNVSTSLSLVMTFNDTIKLGSGDLRLYRKSDVNQPVEKIAAGSGNVIVNDKTLTINLSKTLDQGTSYYVVMDPGFVTTEDGSPYKGITSTTQWTFKTTGTRTSMINKYPTNGATSISPGTKLQMTFNNPVDSMPGGTINIYKNNSFVRTISAKSALSTDRKSFTVDTGSILENNASYYVLVSDNAFKDDDGNYFAGIMSSNDWKFSTTVVNTTALTASFSPANRSTGASADADLVMNFNKEVQRGYGRVSVRKSGTDQEVPTDVISNGTKEVRIRLLPGYRYEMNSTYYVTIENGAFYEKQNTSNTYAGLSGSSWTFSTQATDKTPPVIQSSEIYSNTTIRLVYNKPLYSDSWMSTSLFTVTVNGETRGIYNAYTSGDSVYLTLETGVAVGQNVKISYKGGTGGIRDIGGNAAAAFNQRDVVNGIDTALPKPSSASVSSNTVTLNFSQQLMNVSSNAYEQFTVKADGVAVVVQSIRQSGQTLYLTLSTTVPDKVVTVSYTPGKYPIQDNRGQNISAFTDVFLRNYQDTKPPVFQSAEAAGTKVVLTYNKPLSTTSTPMKSQFSVLVNGQPNYVNTVEIKENKITLTLASTLSKDAKVTISYVPGTSRLTDLNGNVAGYINLEQVKVSDSLTGTGDIKSVIVQGDTLQIIYNKTLLTQSYIAPEQFQVYVNGVLLGVTQASANGNTVTLKLSSSVASGQRVEVTYLPGTSGISDSTGNRVTYFNKLVATFSSDNNSTSSDPNRPAYLLYSELKEFGTSTFSLSEQSFTTTEIKSRNNQVFKKLSVDPEKLKSAFNYIISANEKTHMIMFNAPTGYNSVLVSIPLDALEAAYSKDRSAVIAVRAGDAVNVLELSQLNYTEIARSLYTTSSNVVLEFGVEKLSSDAGAGLNSKIGLASIQKVTEPYDFYVKAVNTSSSTSSIEVSVYNQYWILNSIATTAVKVGLFQWDAASESMTYVPSLVQATSNRQVFRTKIKGNHTVFGGMSYKYFSDLGNHWAKDAINTLAGKMIISGRTKTEYAPNKNITRAEFAEYVARGLGLSGDVSTAQRFYDVTNTRENAFIGAAIKAGIIVGNSDGSFKPNNSITREEMSIMMMRAMEYSGFRTSLTYAPDVYLNKFKDNKQIQNKETIAKLLNEGIIQGISANSFQPRGNATRAQAAVMLQRMLERIQYM